MWVREPDHLGSNFISCFHLSNADIINAGPTGWPRVKAFGPGHLHTAGAECELFLETRSALSHLRAFARVMPFAPNALLSLPPIPFSPSSPGTSRYLCFDCTLSVTVFIIVSVY